jgi:Icc-related predicted phosphoesterase
MKILAISELNGRTEMLGGLRAAIADEAPGMVVFTGNIVKNGSRLAEWEAARTENRPPRRDAPGIREEKHEDMHTYNAFFSTLADAEPRAYVIPGTKDAPLDVFLQVAGNREVIAHNIHVVHNRITTKFVSPQARDMYVCGIGGMINDKESENFFVLQYSRWQALYTAEGFVEYPDPKLLLLHTPPAIMSDKGSKVVDEIISTVRPSHAFCGAIDGLQAEKTVGTTLVVSPGALSDGNYAILDSLAKTVEFKRLEIGVAHPG